MALCKKKKNIEPYHINMSDKIGFAIDVDKPIELEDFDWDGEHRVTTWDSLDEVTSTKLIEYIELLEYLRQKFVKYHEIGYYETLEKLFPFGAYKGKLIEKRHDYRFNNSSK